MYTVTVGADPRVRPDYRNVTAHVDVHRADAGVRPYRYGLHRDTALQIIIIILLRYKLS